jgi:Domain of unknown function (DUF4304)
MNLSRQVSKLIHPVLKKHAFQKESAYWKRQVDQFVFVVSVQASKQGSTQEVLEISLGAFSIEIEELYCQRSTLGARMEEMPVAMMFCHFESNFWCLDEDLGWDLHRAAHRFFPRNEDVSNELLDIAARLSRMLPRFIQLFSSVEKIVDYKRNGLGVGATSTGGKLQAAAGCIVLGRYDDAEALIKEGIKAGSAPLLKEIAARLGEVIQERRSARP